MPSPESTRLTSHVNRRMAVILWTIMAIMTVTMVVVPGDQQRYALIPTVATFAYLTWVTFWLPSITVDQNGVQVANVFSTVTIPWAALLHVDTKFALTLYTPGRKTAVWAAPQPGAASTIRAQRRQGREKVELHLGNAPVRVGDLPGTESGDAALLVRRRWHEVRESGVLADRSPDDAPVTRTVHRALILGAVLLVAGTIVVARMLTA